MSGRRFDVTAVQAVSSMLAALTGAVAASSLGIAGTMIGAGLMSLASTVGAAVYKHYISSGNERLRAAAATLGPLLDPAGEHRDSAHPAGDHAATTPQSARQRARTVSVRGDTAHPGGTPALDGPEPATPTAGGRTVAQVLASADRDTVDLPPAGPGEPADAERADGDAEPGRRGPRWSRRRSLVLAGSALGVFVIAMGVVTAVEVIAGKPLEAVVWHKHASGTTVGGLVGGGQQGHTPPPRHSPSPTGSPGPSTTPPASTSPSSAAPGSSSPAPSGSASPSGPASPNPGTSPPAGPTPQSPSAQSPSAPPASISPQASAG